MPRLQRDVQFKCTEHILEVTGHGFNTNQEQYIFLICWILKSLHCQGKRRQLQ